MKLELKHVLPYLPHGLKVLCEADEGKIVAELESLDYRSNQALIFLESGAMFDLLLNKPKCKMFLCPLSELTEEIESKGQRGGDIFTPTRILMCPEFKFCDDIEELLICLDNPERCPYNVVEKLFEWHFNVFDLPEHLWINKNSLQ